MTDFDSGIESASRMPAGKPSLAWSSLSLQELTWPQRRLMIAAMLAASDVAVTVLGAQVASTSIWVLGLEVRGFELWRWAILLVPFVLLWNGLYKGWGPGHVERLRLRAMGIFWVTLLLICASAGGGLSQAMIVFSCATGSLIVLLGFYGELIARTLLVRCGLWGAPAAIAGHGAASIRVASAMMAHPELGLRPIGYLQDDDAGAVEGPPMLLKKIGPAAIAGLRRDVEVLVFASPHDASQGRLIPVGRLPCTRVVIAYEEAEFQNFGLQTQPFRGPLGMELRRGLYCRYNLIVKRLLDCAITIPALLIAAPVIGLLAAVIKLIDPGPVFYSQTRIGQAGRPVSIVKLRTMYVNADQRLEDYLVQNPSARIEWERYFKLANDPRVVPGLGNFLRRSSLDELPQLLNVLRGEMSLVGPRPFPSYHMSAFDEKFRLHRTSVPPGLTGLWQVSSRSDGDLGIQQAQDTSYIQNWSVWLDLFILLQTLPAVVSARGAR
jgi:Undecaprenyl-phosphate galactose phosphotransferase WbaP